VDIDVNEDDGQVPNQILSQLFSDTDLVLSVQGKVSSAHPTLSFSVSVGFSLTSYPSFVEFNNYFEVTLPAGFTFTSESGVFLTVPVAWHYRIGDECARPHNQCPGRCVGSAVAGGCQWDHDNEYPGCVHGPCARARDSRPAEYWPHWDGRLRAAALEARGVSTRLPRGHRPYRKSSIDLP
jgi:hypothetical protein